MKKIITLFTFLAIITSCGKSDELTKRKAKSILEECFEKTELFKKYIPLSLEIGKNIAIYSNEKLNTYKKLDEKGYIKLKKNEKYYYSVELTHKVKNMTLDNDRNSIEIDILSPPKKIQDRCKTTYENSQSFSQ